MRVRVVRSGVALPSAIIVAVIGLTGCTASAGVTGPTAAEHSEPSTASTPPTVAPTAIAGDETAPHDAHVPVDVTAAEVTTAIAVDAVTRFCRPGLDYDAWIAELYPFLTQQAGAAYETVDPANVPCTAVTGHGRVRDGDGGYTMRILVPTDAGEYSVYVHRTEETAPWAVHQITPVGSE